MRHSLRRTISIALACGLLAVVGAAAHAAEAAPKPEAAAQNPEDAFRARLTEYWDLRIARSQKVYDFYLPPEKGGSKMEDIADLGGVNYQKYVIEDVKIEGDTAYATLQTEATIALPRPMPLPEDAYKPKVVDVWHRTDGVWYREAVEPGISRIWNKQKKTPAAPPAKAEPAAAPEAAAGGKD